MDRQPGNSRNSRRFRKYGLARIAVAWAAVLLQLHLVFVLELHHHTADIPAGPESQGSAVEQTAQVGQNNSLYCPACQIARHGAAQAATAISLVVKVPQEVKILPGVKPEFLSASLFVPAGRAPPLN